MSLLSEATYSTLRGLQLVTIHTWCTRDREAMIAVSRPSDTTRLAKWVSIADRGTTSMHPSQGSTAVPEPSGVQTGNIGSRAASPSTVFPSRELAPQSAALTNVTPSLPPAAPVVVARIAQPITPPTSTLTDPPSSPPPLTTICRGRSASVAPALAPTRVLPTRSAKKPPKMPKGSKEKRPVGVLSPQVVSYSRQFQKAWHLQNNPEIFSEVQFFLQSLAKKHLTLRRTATTQHSAIATLKVKLLEKFPDHFHEPEPEHDKNLYLALRLLFSYHNAARFALKKGERVDVGFTKKKTVRFTQRKEAGTKTIPPIQSATFPVMRTPASRAHGGSSSVHGSAKGGSSVQSPTLPPIPAAPTLAQGRSPCVYTGPTAEEEEFDMDYGVIRRVQQPERATMETVDDGIGAVLRFLSTCTPDMVHLAPDFIEFGITNEGHLHAISRWAKGRRIDFLRDFRSLTATDMEKLVLQIHFETYLPDN
ncbi:hypothetical protein BDZ97DRAFT_1921390 [Flammula alnicola]|nr:hypothetical protein BDZ97DRAFT_1921390 [Flammula alnicola]